MLFCVYPMVYQVFIVSIKYAYHNLLVVDISILAVHNAK